MITLFAEMNVHADKIDAALEACRTVRGPSVLESGCLKYDFYQRPDEPTAIVFFEEWESREALNAHFEEPHFKAFFAAVSDFVTGQPSIRVYEVAGFENL